MGDTILRVDDIQKFYGNKGNLTKAIDHISFSVRKGEFLGIMGASGSGKTTLLNCISTIDTVTSGHIYVEEKDITERHGAQLADFRGKKLGFIFQNFNLIPRLTVIENVALPLVYKGVGKIKRLEAASKILKQFHLGEREYYMPWQLSGGQTQRVAIARALVNEPSIILADEPTGNLDSKSSHIIMEELAEVHKKGNTIIMVTHNPELMAYATRIITMFDGKIDTDTKNRSAKKVSKKVEEDKTLDKIEKITEKLDEIKEELGV